jgi:uncharacterized protein (DUF427 family)
VRALSLWLSGHGIERAFADVFDLMDHCRFRDCKHDQEPGCAVQAAIAAGELDPARLRSLERLIEEEAALEEEQREARWWSDAPTGGVGVRRTRRSVSTTSRTRCAWLIVKVMELAANGKPIESVWDFPRPPRLERVDWRVRVAHAGATVVDAPYALRVLETSQPPAYYVAAEFVDAAVLERSERRTFCEWKGVAEYADIVVGEERVSTPGGRIRNRPQRSPVIREPLGLLCAAGRRVLDRRRARHQQRGKLLRRLGDRQRHRPVQGRPRHQPLVNHVTIGV